MKQKLKVTGPLYTASFVTRAEAEAFVVRLEAEGYRATVSESAVGRFWVRYRHLKPIEVGTDAAF